VAETRAEVPAEARLRLLVEASSLLSDTLDLRAVARGVARSVVPVLADRVHVDLVESLFHPERGAMVDVRRESCDATEYRRIKALPLDGLHGMDFAMA